MVQQKEEKNRHLQELKTTQGMAQEEKKKDDVKQTDFSKLTENDWKKRLTDSEYNVLRQKQTEPWNTGKYNDKFMPKKGYYSCKACLNPLYSWSAKYESGCGWPSFNKCFEGSIKTQIQKTIQVEILCAKCGGHLGHVFRKNHFEYDPNFKKQRHCVNSISIKYINEQIPQNLVKKEDVLDLTFMKGSWR